MLTWYAIVGVLAFVIFGYDKYAAASGRRRIPEQTLWILSLIGGVWGGLLAMFVFRHKIRKPSFSIVMGLIVIVHIVFLILR